MTKTPLQYIPHLLLVAYVLEFTILAFEPYNRSVWWAENVPMLGIVALLTFLYVRGVRFSNLAYLLASVLVFWHTIGGHFTFERVPFDFVSDLFGWERNNFDRIGHFSVGFYAFLFMEYFVTRSIITRKWVAYFAAFSIIGMVAALYEVIEWIYAVKDGGEAGASFLGSQGDIWDAQKDMALDMSGALVALALFGIRNRFKRGMSGQITDTSVTTKFGE